MALFKLSHFSGSPLGKICTQTRLIDIQLHKLFSVNKHIEPFIQSRNGEEIEKWRQLLLQSPVELHTDT